jgi:hypothetical protein
MTFVASLCTLWMGTVMMAGLLKQAYTNVEILDFSTFAIYGLPIAALASIANMLIIGRAYDLYALTVKGAFSVELNTEFQNFGEKSYDLSDVSDENSEDELDSASDQLKIEETPGGETRGQEGDVPASTRKLMDDAEDNSHLQEN